MKLFFLFPVSGPNNGVKIISNHIVNEIFKKKNASIHTVDTAQAKGYGNFGKFSFNKVLFFFKLLREVMAINKKDYVYFNLTPKGFAFYRDFIILVVCRLKTRHVTAHVHANGLEKKIKGFTKFFLSRIKIIVINVNQKEHITKFCPNTFLVPNALPDYYKNNALDFKINKDLNLIFLSNISKEKGVDRIVEIAGLLYKNELKCKLNVFGGALTDNEKSKIENLVSKYDFVEYHGPVIESRQKYKSLLSNDILLFLSDENYEVYPLVYIEALMSGLPIVTTNQVVAKKLKDLGVAQILNNDLSNFVEIITGFLDAKENFKKVKIQTRQKYLDKYSFESFIKKIEEIILYDTGKSN